MAWVPDGFKILNVIDDYASMVADVDRSGVAAQQCLDRSNWVGDAWCSFVHAGEVLDARATFVAKTGAALISAALEDLVDLLDVGVWERSIAADEEQLIKGTLRLVLPAASEPVPPNPSTSTTTTSPTSTTTTTRTTTTTPPTTASSETVVQVNAKLGWQTYPMSISAGTKLQLDVVGGSWTGWVGTEPYNRGVGSGWVCTDHYPASQCLNALPSFTKGALIASTGTDIYAVGSGRTLVPRTGGQLRLRINDDDCCLSDNDGILSVRVRIL